MRKKIMFGSVFVVFLMLMTPHLSAVTFNEDIQSSTKARIGIGFAIGKVKEYYENDTTIVINWIHEGAFIIQWDNEEGLYIGLNDYAGIEVYPKNEFTFFGITNSNFFVVFCILHKI